MTKQRALKRRVRARAAKTGESYTAARAQVLRAAPPAEPPPDAVAAPVVADEAVHRGTGRHLGEWLEILDAWGAAERTHTEIARWLVAEHGVGGWWAQSITVSYERARGMRAPHQQGETFSVAATRTVAADAERVSDALTDPSLRERWLPGAPMRERTTTRGGSRRFDWDDPPSRVVCVLVSKGEGRTQVALQHEKLPDAAAADRMKAMWRERLLALKDMLEA